MYIIHSATLDSYIYSVGAQFKAGAKGKCTPHYFQSAQEARLESERLNAMLKDAGYHNTFSVIDIGNIPQSHFQTK